MKKSNSREWCCIQEKFFMEAKKQLWEIHSSKVISLTAFKQNKNKAQVNAGLCPYHKSLCQPLFPHIAPVTVKATGKLKDLRPYTLLISVRA